MLSFASDRQSRRPLDMSFGLSLSSLGEENVSAEEFADTTELHQKLDELDEIMLSFLADKAIALHSGVDAYAEVDKDCVQVFEFTVPQFTSHDVLCLSVICLADVPQHSTEHCIFNSTNGPSWQPLSVELVRQESNDTFTPSVFNGEYEFTLTSSHGFSKGSYALRVANVGGAAQSIRVHFKQVPYVQATSLSTTTSLTATAEANAFAYFRLRLKNPEQLITVRVRPSEGRGDPDLYISNHFNGYVAVDSSNAVWRAPQAGACQIELHPKDKQRNRGDVYIIGVRGYSEAATFTLSVSASIPEPILQVTAPYTTRLTLSAGSSYYHYLRVDTTRKGKLVISVTPSGEKSMDVAKINQNVGRGVYCIDSLTELGLLCKPTQQSTAMDQTLLFDNLPPSTCKKNNMFPVACLSSSNLYPSPEYCAWMASSTCGAFTIIIETDEFKYTSQHLYIALVGQSLTSKESGNVECMLTVTENLDVDGMIGDVLTRYQFFEKIFRAIDGGDASQKERATMSTSEIQAFTYGEIEFMPFVELLHQCGAADNMIFYDLGCGAGKAVVAAALSGVHFTKCIGIEYLRALCDCAEVAITQTRTQVKDVVSDVLPLMEIRHGDIRSDTSWLEADIVYLSSICFPDALVDEILLLSEGMNPNALLLTLKLPREYAKYFTLVTEKWVKMSWGRIVVYVLRRITDDVKPAIA